MLAALAYVNALHNPFVYDDISEIVDNRSIVSISQLGLVLRHSITRPLTNLSYALDYAAWGLNPIGYHLTNLALHAIDVILWFAVVRVLVQNRWKDVVAFAAASLFAVHPMMTEGVGYVSSRAELLAGVFFFTSFLCFRRALMSGSARWIATGFITFALSICAKETAAMLPLVLIAYDWLLFSGDQPPRRVRVWRVHAPLIALLVLGAVARVWLYVAFERPASGLLLSNVAVNIPVIARYLSLLMVPTALSVVHPVDPVTSIANPDLLGAAVVLVALGTAAWLVRRREPLILFGLLWFLVLLLPSSVLTVISQKAQPIAEHRVYLASCGFFIAIAAAGAGWLANSGASSPARRGVATVAFGCVLAVLFTLTIQRNRVWSDPVLLWSDAVKKAPRVWMAHEGLAEAYHLVGDCESATNEFRRAVLLRPEQLPAYLGLAACLQETDDQAAALRVVRLALTRTPPGPDALLALAELEEMSHNTPEALRLCAAALRFEARRAESSACVARNTNTAEPLK